MPDEAKRPPGKENSRLRYQFTRDQVIATTMANFHANRDARLEYMRSYYARSDRAEMARQRRALRQSRPNTAQDGTRRRRERLRSGFIAPVDSQEVFDRCGGRCHICGRKVDASRKWPDPLSKTIDHLIPVSCDGTHEPGNVSLAHMRCNRRRSNGPLPVQLWLLAG